LNYKHSLKYFLSLLLFIFISAFASASDLKYCGIDKSYSINSFGEIDYSYDNRGKGNFIYFDVKINSLKLERLDYYNLEGEIVSIENDKIELELDTDLNLPYQSTGIENRRYFIFSSNNSLIIEDRYLRRMSSGNEWLVHKTFTTNCFEEKDESVLNYLDNYKNKKEDLIEEYLSKEELISLKKCGINEFSQYTGNSNGNVFEKFISNNSGLASTAYFDFNLIENDKYQIDKFINWGDEGEYNKANENWIIGNGNEKVTLTLGKLDVIKNLKLESVFNKNVDPNDNFYLFVGSWKERSLSHNQFYLNLDKKYVIITDKNNKRSFAINCLDETESSQVDQQQLDLKSKKQYDLQANSLQTGGDFKRLSFLFDVQLLSDLNNYKTKRIRDEKFVFDYYKKMYDMDLVQNSYFIDPPLKNDYFHNYKVTTLESNNKKFVISIEAESRYKEGYNQCIETLNNFRPVIEEKYAVRISPDYIETTIYDIQSPLDGDKVSISIFNYCREMDGILVLSLVLNLNDETNVLSLFNQIGGNKKKLDKTL